MSVEKLRDATGAPPPPAPQRTIFDILSAPAVQKGIEAVAGKYLTADRMLRLCVNAIKKTPRLMQCDPKSVLGAIMASAALGLEPNTVQQQAFLIPYKTRRRVGENWIDVYECQFQIGNRGFITLAYRSPEIKRLVAEAVHFGDMFDHEIGSNTFLRYKKSLEGDRGSLKASFSYVKLANGDELACILPLTEIYKIRSRSETYRSLTNEVATAANEKEKAKAQQKLSETPWVFWEDDMAAKSAIKKHAKQLPIAAGDLLAIAAEIDSTSDLGKLDLRALADVDTLRTVVEGTEPPALAHEPSESIEETLPAAARQAEPEPAQKAQAEAPRTRRATPAPAPAPAPAVHAPKFTDIKPEGAPAPAPAPAADSDEPPTNDRDMIAQAKLSDYISAINDADAPQSVDHLQAMAGREKFQGESLFSAGQTARITAAAEQRLRKGF